jgi:hypothetical protein
LDFQGTTVSIFALSRRLFEAHRTGTLAKSRAIGDEQSLN